MQLAIRGFVRVPDAHIILLSPLSALLQLLIVCFLHYNLHLLNGDLFSGLQLLIFILHYLQISVQGDESGRVTDLRMYIILASQPHVLAQKTCI